MQNAISFPVSPDENQPNHRTGRIIENSFLFLIFHHPEEERKKKRKSNGIYY